MLRAIAVMAAKLPALVARRLRARAAGGDPLDLALDGLRDQGTHVTLRFTEGEPLRDEFARSGHLDRLTRWPGVRLHDILGPAETHTLQVVRMQPAVHEAMDAFLAEQRARLDGAGDGGAPARAASGAGA
jgi:hypothetical protein